MEPTFMVSAPGKVIVMGEHAAVYGEPVIAAAISLRSYLHITTLPESQRIVRLKFGDIGLDHTWQIGALPWHAFQQSSKKDLLCTSVTALDANLVNAIRPHAEAAAQGCSPQKEKMLTKSSLAFLYLFMSLGSPKNPGFMWTLRSTIPTGAGLGSSASVCVCMSAALLLQTRALALPFLEQDSAEAAAQVELINRWAFVGELCLHGNPSGVDNTVSAGGKAVLFQKTPSGEFSVNPLTAFPELPLILVDTQQQRSTEKQVQLVRELRDNVPSETEMILSAIGRLTRSAEALIKANDFSAVSGKFDALEHVGTLIRMNHGLLVSLGVSHPRLERVRELVDDAELGWAKLTGAGGGGCAIVLTRRGVREETTQVLEQKLTAEGFRAYKAVLSANGIGVLWPGTLRSGTSDKAVEEIDQRRFENAVGVQDIERLVGLEVGRDQGGWKFWL